VETLWEPLLVLDEGLRVVQANQAFYQFFQTIAEATEQHVLAELGNGQWNIPVLRVLLQHLLHFEVNHTFPAIGHKNLFQRPVSQQIVVRCLSPFIPG
ncbi:MAG TPA: hypothetical protein VFV38_34855, partial [Ktedonobacteraceae bacterium]|nr:hypothetical protein [Ktedonobacteraceae bacterium]